MDNDQKIRIASQSTDAVHSVVYPFTISMIDIGKNPMELCSGTLVRLDNRVFVATAKHCVPNSPSGRLWILPEQPRSPSEGMLGFSRYGRHPSLDVAYLELDPQSLVDYLPSHSCCALGHLSNHGCGRANRIITVCGSPVQFIDGAGTEATPLKASNIAYSTAPFTPAEFPTVPPGDRPSDESVDIFFEYPTEGLRFAAGTTIQLGSPEGLSGGGIWDQGFDSETVWSPTNAKMIGIQSAWHRSERYARGIQVIHWLQLMWSEIDDRRPCIETAFPDETFVSL